MTCCSLPLFVEFLSLPSCSWCECNYVPLSQYFSICFPCRITKPRGSAIVDISPELLDRSFFTKACCHARLSKWNHLNTNHTYRQGDRFLFDAYILDECMLCMYKGWSKSSQPDLVLLRIKLKYYLLLILARLRTWHALYDFWAINILCILAVIDCLHSTWKKWSYAVWWNNNFDQFVRYIACFVVLTQNWSCGCTFYPE